MPFLDVFKYFLPEVDSEYSDSFDGKYKYIRSTIILPRFFTKLLGLPEPRIDRRKKRYGRIRVNPFYYITFPMIFILGIVFASAILSFETLVVYFNTNVFLNGLIISLMIFGILKVFHNSYMLYGTARFFRKMEKIMYKDVLDEDDIPSLRNALESHGELVNTIYMSQTIDNVMQFGHPNFNGMRSRLIKSKLGFRTSKNKSNVNFIAGILVMLGLLGTFLGLLATIDSVGEALNSMSSIGGDSGEIGTEEMASFIGSLAAPLDGMGLAFSSSLFGLSGSLLIGFFLHLGGTPQNEFIENVSRWIDDREIKFDPNVKKGSITKVPPNEDDIKEWLSGFIHMSVKTNRVVSKLSKSVDSSTQETIRAWGELRGLTKAEQVLNTSIKALGVDIAVIKNQGQAISDSLPHVMQEIPEISAQLKNVVLESSVMSSNVSNNNQMMSQYVDYQKQNAEKNVSSLSMLKNLMIESNEVHKQSLALQANSENNLNEALSTTEKSFNSMNTTLSELIAYEEKKFINNDSASLNNALVILNKNQSEVLEEIKRLLNRLQKDPHMMQAESLVKQLDKLLNELNQKTKSFFSNRNR